MAVIYNCRHCGNTIGRIENNVIDIEHLGLHSLTDEERQQMVEYQSSGDIQVKSICEHCEEALNRNPNYHEMDTFLQ